MQDNQDIMEQILHNKKLGIWGYGVVGKSVSRFIQPFAQQISVFDHTPFKAETVSALALQQIRVYHPTELYQFLEEQDVIIPSPGIDLTAYQPYAHKFIAEFDLFCDSWKKQIIAITGTVGKTSITHLLSQLLALKKNIATGGNIGTGMLDLVATQEKVEAALLELSSFQLELCIQAAPDLAIITNLYPNHLDRHGSFEQYCAAKYKIFAHQRTEQQALIPLELLPELRAQFAHKTFCFFSAGQPSPETLDLLSDKETLYYLHEQTIYRYSTSCHEVIAQLTPQHLSYPQNWLIIYAVLDLLHIPLELVMSALPTLNIPDHRLACIAQHNGISFYNDSKATVPEAMLAAVKKLHGAPLILFLGGVSKGVDRAPALQQLQQYSIKQVICFGKEAEQLHQTCKSFGIPSSAHRNLDDAFTYCMQTVAQPGDNVLFSPAGASFDLYKNYEERGEVFKKLVLMHSARNIC